MMDTDLVVSEEGTSSESIGVETDEDSESIRTQIETIDVEIGENEYQIQQIQERQEHLQFQRELLVEKLNVKNAAKTQKLSGDFDGTEFPWSNKLTVTLQTTFKIKELRPQQLPTINATMAGYDCILIMPTGGGKSLCFQLPALLSDGITLVVSPLVSLMEDQLMALKNLRINAEILTASTSKAENKRILQEMITPTSKLKILYVTPEKLSKSKMFLSRVQKMYGLGNFSLLAVDEVHCCSQWGHDFRKDYKFLGVMKRQFPKVPILGLTATATTRVVKDVQKMLGIENCLVFRAPFNRPNLVYKVFPKPSVQKEVIEELGNIIHSSYSGQSGIVYCLSIKETEEVSNELQKRNISALPYHANLEAKYRSMVHSSWVANDIQVVVATIAFGMGIDKPDVRFVIHHTMSRTIENYYQESGRAGRDNRPADCIIFYRFGDIFRQSGMVISDTTGLTHLYAMVAFCTERKRCRRAILADHFGELWDESHCNKMCDNCNLLLAYGGSKSKITEIVDISNYGRDVCKILDNAKALKQNLTALKLIDTWISKRKSNISSADVIPPKIPREECERIITHLLLEGYLQEKFSFTVYNTISYIIKGTRSASLQKSTCKIEMELIKITGRGTTSKVTNTDISTSQTANAKTPGSTNSVKVNKTVAAKDKAGFKPCVVNKKNSKFTKGTVIDNRKIGGKFAGIATESPFVCDKYEPDLIFDESSSSEHNETSQKKHIPLVEIDDTESDSIEQVPDGKLPHLNQFKKSENKNIIQKQSTLKRKATIDKTTPVRKKAKSSS